MIQLAEKPWNSSDLDAPAGALDVVGMLGEEERRCLFWLARHAYSGQGFVVDAGSFIGASAYCLAGGLSRNPAAAGAHARIHAYDLFVARDKYVADSITRNIRPLALGEPYLDIFQRQNAEIRV